MSVIVLKCMSVSKTVRRSMVRMSTHTRVRTVPHLAISLDPWGPMLWGLCGDCENCVWGGVGWSGVGCSGVGRGVNKVGWGGVMDMRDHSCIQVKQRTLRRESESESATAS